MKFIKILKPDGSLKAIINRNHIRGLDADKRQVWLGNTFVMTLDQAGFDRLVSLLDKGELA